MKSAVNKYVILKKTTVHIKKIEIKGFYKMNIDNKIKDY